MQDAYRTRKQHNRFVINNTEVYTVSIKLTINKKQELSIRHFYKYNACTFISVQPTLRTIETGENLWIIDHYSREGTIHRFQHVRWR